MKDTEEIKKYIRLSLYNYECIPSTVINEVIDDHLPFTGDETEFYRFIRDIKRDIINRSG